MRDLSQGTYIENSSHILDIAQIKVRDRMLLELLPIIDGVIWDNLHPNTAPHVSSEVWENVLNNVWDNMIRPTHLAIKNAFHNDR
jgi:hypothetical protein